jgi:hypothetical protein
MTSPFEKIYFTSSYLEHLSLVLFLFVISQKDKLIYDPVSESLKKKKKDDVLDPIPLVIGLNTILHQFHSSEKLKFLSYLGQYIRSRLDGLVITDKSPEIPSDVRTILCLMEEFSRLANIPRKVIESYVPRYLFAKYVVN